MAKTRLRLVTPNSVKGTVQRAMPRRPRNAELRTREHLTPNEVDALIEAARKDRNGHRNATAILVCYRHGLRLSEVCDLQWQQIDLNAGRLHCRRLKNGLPSTHPLQGDEIRALRRLQRESIASPFVFVSERAGPFTPKGIARMIERAARKAKLEIKAHTHMLRHGAGFALAAQQQTTRGIQAWLGHRSIGNTVIYTALAPDQFNGFWRKGRA